MAAACALAMFSGKNIFIFVVQKRLRAFLNHFFTRGVWNELPQSPTATSSPGAGEGLSSKGEALA